MAALTANAALDSRNDTGKTRKSLVVLTGAKIFRHALVQETAAGLAEPCDDNTTATFAGYAVDEVDSGDGVVTVELFNDNDIRITAAASVTAGMVMDTAIFAADDGSVTEVTTLGPQIGVVTEFVASTDVWVRLRQNVLIKGA